jgi:hypothetical protein
MEDENIPEIIEENPKETVMGIQDLIQYLENEKIESEKQKEILKQEQIDSEILEQKEILEKNKILEQQELEEKEINDLKEQELLDSEIEFRENLLTDLKATNLKLDEVITYNSKSDGFSDDISLVSEKMDLLVTNTEHTELQETNDNLASFADVAMIALVIVVLPIYVVYRFFKAILSPIL